MIKHLSAGSISVSFVRTSQDLLTPFAFKSDYQEIIMS